MKLASLKHGRDGRLVVVSGDLSRYADAGSIAPTMQHALDDWRGTEPRLRQLSHALEARECEDAIFDSRACVSPLPRAFQWADGSAYVNHVELVRRARGAELPDRFWTDPLMYQGGSDAFLAPTAAIPLPDEAWGLDCEAEIAVIVDDVPQGVTSEAARAHIELVMLVNDVSLRQLIPGELEKGFGFFQSKPASAFSPIAVAPDALGNAWDGAKLSGALLTSINGAPFGRPDAGREMTFDFGQLITHAAKTRALCAGTIIGSGTVSTRSADGGPGRPISEGGDGYSCMAELRMVETILGGAPRTPFLKRGDSVRIEMRDSEGRDIFGAIDQVVD